MNRKDNTITYTYKENLEQVYRCFTDIKLHNKIEDKCSYNLCKIVSNKNMDVLNNTLDFYLHQNYVQRRLIFNANTESSTFKTFSQKVIAVNNKPVDEKDSIVFTYTFYADTSNNSTILQTQISTPNCHGHSNRSVIGYETVQSKNQRIRALEQIALFLKHFNAAVICIDSIEIQRPMKQVWNVWLNHKEIMKVMYNKSVIVNGDNFKYIEEIAKTKHRDSCAYKSEMIEVSYNVKEYHMTNDKAMYLIEKEINGRKAINNLIRVTLIRISDISCYWEIVNKIIYNVDGQYLSTWQAWNENGLKKLKSHMEKQALEA